MRAFVLVGIVALAVVARDASAEAPAPVTVIAHGPKTIKVRLSVGRSTPCDASSNRQLYTGPMKPGEHLVWPFHEACACLEQTYDDFPDAGWGSPLLRCRPQFCIGGYCGPDTRFPIQFDVHSKRPD
jgi:hypothetical protein